MTFYNLKNTFYNQNNYIVGYISTKKIFEIYYL